MTSAAWGFLDVDEYPLMEVAAARIDPAGRGLRAGGPSADAGTKRRSKRSSAALDGPAAGPRLQVSGTARLDLRAVGIRVPGFLVRRFVYVPPSAQLTQPPPGRPGSW